MVTKADLKALELEEMGQAPPSRQGRKASAKARTLAMFSAAKDPEQLGMFGGGK
jgi:hypothetical protein